VSETGSTGCDSDTFESIANEMIVVVSITQLPSWPVQSESDGDLAEHHLTCGRYGPFAAWLTGWSNWIGEQQPSLLHSASNIFIKAKLPQLHPSIMLLPP
jgi:hypothetical protein